MDLTSSQGEVRSHCRQANGMESVAAPVVGRCNLLWWEVVSWTGSDPSWGSKMIVTAEADS